MLAVDSMHFQLAQHWLGRIVHEVLRGAVVQAASLYLGNTGTLPVLQRAPVDNPG